MFNSEELDPLREELLHLNTELYKIIRRRQLIVNKIQSLKKSGCVWDPSQEILVFNHLSQEDKKILPVISLLIELQASNNNSYPRWSLGEHLELPSVNLRNCINPVFLYLSDDYDFNIQNLKEPYRSKIISSMEKKMSKVIAIDGPSGSGKSTIAKLVAKKLDFIYLDTGAMFRAIGYMLQKNQILFSDLDSIKDFMSSMSFEYGESENVLIRINNIDLTAIIREHEVSKLASEVSQIDLVRSYLKDKQREIASKQRSVLEGRDIGSVIFPDAPLKVFLTADPEIRAKRRYEQLIEKDPKNSEIFSVESILEDIIVRDKKDTKRDIAPLVKPSDAFEIDTSHIGIEGITENIIELYKARIDLFC